MQESKMSRAVNPSLTRKLFNMALAIGNDVINLTLGDPDVLPPIEIREAACKAIMEGKTRYSANAGLKGVREQYSHFFKKEYGFEINPDKEIIATVGGMEALFLSLSSLIDSGDEVLLFGPYYVNYYQIIKMCGGIPVVINRLGISNDTFISRIRGAITKKTKAIIINSPCNPVGDVLPTDLLRQIAKIAKEYDLSVISDEVYNSLVFDGEKAESVIQFPGMRERTIIIDSCSKRFAMTGWRIGFAVGPENVIANMTKMQENVAACAPLPSQYAAIQAYSDNTEYSYIKETYEHRRNLVYDALKEMKLLGPIRPEATFYCFVSVKDTGLSGEEFSYKLLETQHVAVVPGKAYGDEYDKYIRIAFTLNDDLLCEAMKRIHSFCESISK